MWFYVLLIVAVVVVMYFVSGPIWKLPKSKGSKHVEEDLIRAQNQINRDTFRNL